MLRLLDTIEKLLDEGHVCVSCDGITNIELQYLKSALGAKITRTPDDEYSITAYWKYEGN